MSKLGEITRCYNILYERRTRHTPDRLWRAITDSAEVSQWMGYPARVDVRVGGDYFVDFGADSEENLDGVIVRLSPGRSLAYAWGLSVLEWTLEPDGDGCSYTFLHHGMPQRNIPDEQGVAVGWHLWLDDLESHLSGTGISDEIRAQQAGLSAAYRKTLDIILG